MLRNLAYAWRQRWRSQRMRWRMAATAVVVTTAAAIMVAGITVAVTTAAAITAAAIIETIMAAAITVAAIMVEIITVAAITAAIIMVDITALIGTAMLSMMGRIGAATVTADTGMAAGGGAAMASARAGGGLLPAMFGSATKNNNRDAGTGQLPVTITSVAKSGIGLRGLTRISFHAIRATSLDCLVAVATPAKNLLRLEC